VAFFTGYSYEFGKNNMQEITKKLPFEIFPSEIATFKWAIRI
jgi:hypothetical protein